MQVGDDMTKINLLNAPEQPNRDGKGSRLEPLTAVSPGTCVWFIMLVRMACWYVPSVSGTGLIIVIRTRFGSG